MRIQFPAFVFISPGMHPADGGTYNYRTVLGRSDLERAMEDGYYLTIPEAIKGEHEDYDVELVEEGVAADDIGYVEPVPEPLTQRTLVDALADVFPPALAAALRAMIENAEPVVDLTDDKTSPPPPAPPPAPTREELEAQAAKLDIKFGKSTADKTLAEKIEFVLAKQEA